MQEIVLHRAQLKFSYSISRTTTNKSFQVYFQNFSKKGRKNTVVAKANKADEGTNKSE